MDNNPPEGEWLRTQELRHRLKVNPLYEEPYGTERIGRFAGRPIITRDTPINGGVYLGSSAREAIVVDDRKYPQELNAAYTELRRKMTEGVSRGRSVFECVYEVTKRTLDLPRRTGDVEERVDELVGSIVSQSGPDAKVTLNEFMREGIGICRHRALLAGYLIERLVKEGVLRGKVSVDRNYLPKQGGHAWVRWEGAGGNPIIIIDSSLGYVGPIERAPRNWNYNRPANK
ncbi:MAG: hypothetical protein Q8Q15_00740 [bacterium]|nr:hypothetical protein [bacterium]